MLEKIYPLVERSINSYEAAFYAGLYAYASFGIGYLAAHGLSNLRKNREKYLKENKK